MEDYGEVLESKEKNIEQLYSVYPVLEKIDNNNNGIITSSVNFKNLFAGEYIKSVDETCYGVLFVLKGTIKIEKINLEGEQTNLYNIRQGEFCHEVLSCLANLESLNIMGKAIQDSKICIIPMDVMKKYIMNDVEFLSYIYQDLYRKFNTVIENKEKMIHESLETRLVKLLISKKSKIVYVTHSELAFEIDSVREVVSRKLKAMEKSGYIKLERGKIVILKDLNEMLIN